jgi:hypothetical protein
LATAEKWVAWCRSRSWDLGPSICQVADRRFTVQGGRCEPGPFGEDQPSHVTMLGQLNGDSKKRADTRVRSMDRPSVLLVPLRQCHHPLDRSRLSVPLAPCARGARACHAHRAHRIRHGVCRAHHTRCAPWGDAKTSRPRGPSGPAPQAVAFQSPPARSAALESCSSRRRPLLDQTLLTTMM